MKRQLEAAEKAASAFMTAGFDPIGLAGINQADRLEQASSGGFDSLSGASAAMTDLEQAELEAKRLGEEFERAKEAASRLDEALKNAPDDIRKMMLASNNFFDGFEVGIYDAQKNTPLARLAEGLFRAFTGRLPVCSRICFWIPRMPLKILPTIFCGFSPTLWRKWPPNRLF